MRTIWGALGIHNASTGWTGPYHVPAWVMLFPVHPGMATGQAVHPVRRHLTSGRGATVLPLASGQVVAPVLRKEWFLALAVLPTALPRVAADVRLKAPGQTAVDIGRRRAVVVHPARIGRNPVWKGAGPGA